MGLSSDERVSIFLWTAQHWRKGLSSLYRSLGDSKVSCYTDEKCNAIVKKWIQKLDLLVGNTLKNGNPLLSLRSDTHQAYASNFRTETKGEFESAPWWQSNADYEMTARRLQFPPFKSHPHLLKLALWWDCYDFIDSALYPLHRYSNGLFDNILEPFAQLHGEIVNRRFDVCFGDFIDDAEENFKIAENTERFLLLKHDIFHSLLKDKTKNIKGDAFFKKTFNGYALYEAVGKMTIKEMNEFFKKKTNERYVAERKFDSMNTTKPSKPDGLFGLVGEE